MAVAVLLGSFCPARRLALMRVLLKNSCAAYRLAQREMLAGTISLPHPGSHPAAAHTTIRLHCRGTLLWKVQ